MWRWGPEMMRKAGQGKVEGRRGTNQETEKMEGTCMDPKLAVPRDSAVMGEQQEDVQTPRKENGNDNGRERSERVMSGGGKNGKVDSGIGGAKK